MRTERYRYTEWRDFSSGKVLARELYDLSEDAIESDNIVARPASASVLPRVAALLGSDG